MADLPDFLNLPPEKIAENNQRDSELRKKFASRLKMSPFEYERARAMTLEADQRKTVKAHSRIVSLKRAVAAEGVGDVPATDVDEAIEAQNLAKRQLAESLAAQGKFLDAANQTTDKDERKTYKKIAKAIWAEENGDAADCDCEAPTGQIGGEIISLPKYRVVRRVYSIKDAAEMNLLECVVCGKWFVRPIQAQTTEKVSDLELLKTN